MELVDEYNRLPTLKSIQPWVVCFAASLFFFYEFIQGNMFASIVDNMMQDFSIQVDKVTYLSSVYYLSNVIFLFVAGMMLDRLSTKKTMMIAMVLCILSTFILANTSSFYMALCCRFVAGIGSAFCFLGPIRIASRWFSSGQMAFVTGLIVTIAMTGGMIAQYPLTHLVVNYGWRESLSIVAWLGVGLLIIMLILIKDKPFNAIRPNVQVDPIHLVMKQAYLNIQNLRVGLYTSLMNMGVAVFGAMMGTLYVVERLGVTKPEAAMVNSMLFMGAIMGGPFMGWLSDKMQRRILPMKIGAMSSFIIILSIMYLPVSLTGMAALFFLLGFCTASQVISYAMVAESMPPALTATAVSLISILTQGGYIVYQNLFSHILMGFSTKTMIDQNPFYSLDAYQTAALIIPTGLLLAFVLISRLKETYCRQVESN